MKRLRLFLVLVLGLSLVPAVLAKEGGDQYPNGGENWFAGATPPPGFYYINYFGYYSGELRNGSGDKVSGTPKVDATFDAFRFVEMTKFKILGADYGVHVIVPVVEQSMNFGGRAKMLSVGDITFDPIILGWHRPTWHIATGLDINLPTGHFNRADPRVSVGANYYSFEPVFSFSLMPKCGWETSAKLMYNIKTTNDATKYHSGQEFHADYMVGKHVGPLMAGASGYFLQQTTDDTVSDQAIPAMANVFSAGRRGRVFAAGPSLGYTNKHHMTFILQWQHEMAVQNRFSGEKLWFKMILPASSFRSKS